MAVKAPIPTLKLELNGEMLLPQVKGYNVKYQTGFKVSKNSGGLSDQQIGYRKPPVIVTASYLVLGDGTVQQAIQLFKFLIGQEFVAHLSVGHGGFEDFKCKFKGSPRFNRGAEYAMFSVVMEVEPEYDSVTINFIKTWGPLIGLQKEFFLCIYEGLIALPEPRAYGYPAPPSFHVWTEPVPEPVDPPVPDPEPPTRPEPTPEPLPVSNGVPYTWTQPWDWADSAGAYEPPPPDTPLLPFTWKGPLLWHNGVAYTHTPFNWETPLSWG